MLARARLAVAVLAVLGSLLSAAGASAAPGELDPSFGSGGVAKILLTKEEARGAAVATQADGKVVIAGSIASGNILLVRLLPNGEFDPDFGVGGKVQTILPGGFSEARAVAIATDGKIVIAGEAQAVGPENSDFLVGRYNSDGSPDPSFGGGDGFQLVPFGAKGDFAEAVAIAPDGRIVVTGTTALAGTKTGAGVAVLLAGGTPDPSFGGGTKVVKTPSEEYDGGEQVAMLADGRVLLASSTGAGGGDGFTMVRLLASGAFDPSFGGDGIVETPIPITGATGSSGRVTDFALLADGRIVASGYGVDYVGPPSTFDAKLVAVKYLPDGELDPTFAAGGIFGLQMGVGSDSAAKIEVTDTGKLVLAGEYTFSSTPVSISSPALLRLNPAGTVDPSFGSGGLVLRGKTTPFGETVADADLDSQGRLVTLGTAYEGAGMTNVVITRYQGEPRPLVTVRAAVNLAPRTQMKKVPRKLLAEDLKRFSGTATDPEGEVLRKVQIAVVKRPGGAKASAKAGSLCLVMKNAKASFKQVKREGKQCPQRWLAAKGKAKWSFGLKRELAPGNYVVYARAVDARGVAETGFSRRAGNRYAFRVLASD